MCAFCIHNFMQTFFCIFLLKTIDIEFVFVYYSTCKEEQEFFYIQEVIIMKIISMPRFVVSMTILFIIVSFFMNMFFTKVFSYEEEKFESVVVCQGETLWSIASNLGGNVNENIYNIKKLNSLDGANIFVGQELVVPVK